LVKVRARVRALGERVSVCLSVLSAVVMVLVFLSDMCVDPVIYHMNLILTRFSSEFGFYFVPCQPGPMHFNLMAR
jgi:hypothetical protein